jgi:type IV secretory pathway component VirB8
MNTPVEEAPIDTQLIDAAYSHMLLNMRFSFEELNFIFSERVVKPRGFNFFSVRNQNDKSSCKILFRNFMGNSNIFFIGVS